MKMKNLFIALLIIYTHLSYAADDKAIHPPPKTPTLIAANLLVDFKKNLTPPPLVNSDGQKNDEKILKEYQVTRSEPDCLRAKSEVYVSLASFYGKPYGPLSDEEVAKLAPRFEQVRNDADYYIQLLKIEFPRQRPFLYIEGLVPCVAKEVTGAYPSGHSTLARLYALILADLYPTKKDLLFKRAEVIATDRVLAGMHHPSDIKTGKELGEVLYKEFKRSELFNTLFKNEHEYKVIR